MAAVDRTNPADIAAEEVQRFVFLNEHLNEQALVLKSRSHLGIPSGILADQIAGRRKAKVKLPTWHQTRGMVYPPAINLEQCSSEHTAQYKADEVSRWMAHPVTGVDLTGGLGIDSWKISQRFGQWTYVDPDQALLDAARHNHEALGLQHVSYQGVTAEDFLNANAAPVDFIIIDPSRRAGLKKVYGLKDCTPDVIQLKEVLLSHASLTLIKASPMLDLQQGIRELGCVVRADVVAVDNECKELLFWCRPVHEGTPAIRCVNLSSSNSEVHPFEFDLTEEKKAVAEFSDPLLYLYEPDASILKAGAFKTIATRFNLFKIAPHTHFYTSPSIQENFPGRIFQLITEDPDNLKKHFPNHKANIITRNYPLGPAELKKKYKLEDGGEAYLLGFSGINRKFLFPAHRLQ